MVHPVWEFLSLEDIQKPANPSITDLDKGF